MLTACDCISKAILAYCLRLYPYMPSRIFREHAENIGARLRWRPTTNSLRIDLDPHSILTESPMTVIRRATSFRTVQFKHLIKHS